MPSQNLGRVTGKNAYELAVEDGFSGTLQEWLASLHGKDGANGTNGINGTDGANGVDGITPDFQIGDVTTLPAGSSATATITGTPEVPVLNMGIPRGDKGEDGSSSGGGIPDAPADKKLYGRKNNSWDEVVIPPTYNDTEVRGLITANTEDISGLETSKADKTEIPDVSGFATKQEVTQGLAGKQPTGDYATNAALTQGLAEKQPTGDYATNTALTQGLATKQPVGDYATTAQVDAKLDKTTTATQTTLGLVKVWVDGTIGYISTE